jgi:hypothetical protein
MKIKKNVAISESGYIFNPTTGESFSVNPIGIEIFNLIKEEKSYEEISKTVLAKYNTDEDTFEKDYHDFVGMLNQYLLIEKENEKAN